MTVPAGMNLVGYSDLLELRPLTGPVRATVAVPGSKSITNRALVLAALSAKGYACALRGALPSEDTEVMVEGLRRLGFRVLTEWPEPVIFVSSGEDEPTIPAREADLFVANSGTTMRFLTALVCLGRGRYRLDGVARMRERPIADLLDALQRLGVSAASEHGNGCPPVTVAARGLPGGRVRIKGDVSSQFLSALLLAAPHADRELAIEVEKPLVSWPYVFMTAQMLRRWGYELRQLDDPLLAGPSLACGERDNWGQDLLESSEPIVFHVPPNQQVSAREKLEQWAAADARAGRIGPQSGVLLDYRIEPDASAASYFFAAAAVAGGEVTVPHLHRKSLQGDIRFVEVLADMGCDLEYGPDYVTVRGGSLYGIDVDMNDISDCVMTLAAVACFADGPTSIRNVAHIRHKETDRLKALATELRRVGARVEELPDGLTIVPGPLHGATIETYNDHRMAMSMALIGLRVPGVVVRNPGCVAKTYPGFFADLERLRAGVA
jgi:3-phosphoshikimate 1-carboxyvinyltransferase